ncbi:hypothetical protein SAMN04489761_4311 [Tenacibaculum sp. MAR_2009_124]|nr:hypothetical protein [Tenacibaculum sp. MAR_2009_124]SED11202.1 hypothetical protein SAMN04489761_4311 [Tenacibaculum sp. MAR_2009_124]
MKDKEFNQLWNEIEKDLPITKFEASIIFERGYKACEVVNNLDN